MSTLKHLAIYQELKELIVAESQAQQTNHEKVLQMPVALRVEQGKCVESISYRKWVPDGLPGHSQRGGVLRFNCEENLSEFREGDRVVIHTGDPFHPFAQGYWVRDGQDGAGREFIDLSFPDHDVKRIHGSQGVFTLDSALVDLSSQLLKAIDEMGASDRGRNRILPLISGDASPEDLDLHIYDEAATAAQESDFNDPQQDAVGMGVAADWCVLIQGPPGTGKTRVLAQIVRERLKLGQRILVTACTHRAIHEALNRIFDLNPGLKRIAKVGSGGDNRTLKAPVCESFEECGFDSSPEGYVIGATPYTAFSERLKHADFHCVIIDEASQMTLPLAVMAMLSADRYVVIGDEMQLPPVLHTKSAFRAKDYGLFQRLRSVANKEILTVTYRMNKTICDWISSEFYFGELEPHERCCDKVLQLSGPASQDWLDDALSGEHSMVWITTRAETTRHFSMEQAGLVCQLLEELHGRGHPLGDVGVITPFRRQGRVIRQRLRQTAGMDSADLEQLVVDTVERMQGQERSVIILSTAAADSRFLSAIQEFLYLPSRLNVIVSRAKVKVIVLASDQFLETQGHSDEVCSAVDQWRSLRDTCHLIEI